MHNSPEDYQYDEDVIVTLAGMCACVHLMQEKKSFLTHKAHAIDWYHEESHVNLASFLNVNNPTGAEPVPQSGLIMDNVNSSLTFQPGKTYRLRLINMSGFSMFYFSIDGHMLDVIEMDGVSTYLDGFSNH